MSTTIDPDGPRAASHRHMFAHIPGPLAGGALDNPLPMDGSGLVTCDRLTREPLVLVMLRTTLDDETLTLDAELLGNPLTRVEFAPYSEAGTALILHRPPVDASTRLAAPFTLKLTSASLDRLEVRLVEGVMGALTWLLGAEKARIRRVAREVAAMRTLATARDDALDRIGAELAVPRLAEDIEYAASQNEIVTQTYPDGREPDDEYRRRLKIYRPFLVPNRARVLELLNGPGAMNDPNRGLLGELGLGKRIDIVEDDNPFAVGVHLIGVGNSATTGDSRRLRFLEYLRETSLVRPGATVPAKRYLRATERQREQTLRDDLAALYTWSPSPHIMPALASALRRAGACRVALGNTTPWQVTKTQDDNGTSRYELGLGVALTAPASSVWSGLAAALAANSIAPSTSAETRGLLASMKPPTNLADDPDGKWFFEACGLRTVHRIASSSLYLSHLPVLGLELSGAHAMSNAGETWLTARLHAPGDPGANAVLQGALTAAAASWSGSGGEPWVVLGDTATQVAWAALIATVEPSKSVFAAAEVPAIVDANAVRTTLGATSPDLVRTLALGPTLSADVLSGDPLAGQTLRALLDALASHDIVAALPFTTSDGRVLVVTGVVALPLVGLNLGAQRATGFRWFSVPVGKEGHGHVHTLGDKAKVHADQNGVQAIVVLSYARQGATDPYEVRAQPPKDALLDLHQYEMVMNILDHAHPIGVEMNTWTLRKQHVALDGGTVATPLSPAVARTYRPFRRKRHLGERSVTLDDNS